MTFPLSIGSDAPRQVFHKVIQKELVVLQSDEHVPGCPYGRLFALAYHWASQVCMPGHVVVCAPAPIHAVLAQSTSRAFFVVVPPLFQYGTLAGHIQARVDIAKAKRGTIVLSNEPFTRIDVAAWSESPLSLAHTAPVRGCMSPFEQEDHFAIDEVDGNLLSALVALDVEIADFHISVLQL
jgi:hypothetical protein